MILIYCISCKEIVIDFKLIIIIIKEKKHQTPKSKLIGLQ